MHIKSFKKIMPGLVIPLMLGLATSHSVGANNDFTDAKIDGFKIKQTLDLVLEGKQTFRSDTFGDQDFWSGQLRLHEAIAGEANGGVGPGITPATALALGLKVDIDALPKPLQNKLIAGKVDLENPATTLALLKHNAVIGITGFFDTSGRLNSIGIQCALCHTQVDNAIAPGVGHRLDGWANRDLNVGAIIAAAPNLTHFASLLGTDQNTVRTVLRTWGPGKFDAALLLDGKAFRPDGKSAATLIPPIFGLAGVNLSTWTGWGSITHWNALVAVLEMGGKGRFYDPRLNDSTKYPIAAANGFGNIQIAPEADQVTAKLAGLQMYQLSIPPPKAPEGTFDKVAAQRGETVFNGKARCASCHVPPLYTEPGHNSHRAADIGIDSFQADRGPDNSYRTAPLNGLWTHHKGGFYHDGRFSNLLEVINHYDSFMQLQLHDNEKADLTEFLKSL